MYSHRGIGEDMVGGALVRRMIPGKPEWPGGYMLSREEFLAIPVENRWVLVEQEHFEIIIRDPAARRFIVPREDGRFDVVSGRALNTEPLERDAADQLASDGRPIVARPQSAPARQATPSADDAEAPKRRGRKPMSDEQRDAKRAQQNAERRLRRRARGADQHAEHT